MRGLIVLIFLIWSTFFVFFDTYSQNDNYVTSQYTITDGLPHNRVSSLAFDKQGFLWLATANGLFRFDSYKFEEYAKTKTNATAINSPYLESLLVDSKGNIWAGYYVGGLIKYNTTDQSIVSYSPSDNDSSSICNTRIKTICEDKLGNIWVGSGGSGIAKLDEKTGKFKHYLRKKTKDNDWTGTSVNQLICTKDSTIWAACIGGLYKYNKSKDSFERIKSQKKSNHKQNEFACLVEDTLRNCLWLGTWSSSLGKLDLQTDELTFRKNKATSTASILIDSQGTIWLGSWGKGLYRYYADSNKFERHTFEGDSTKIKSIKVIRKITEHSSGEIWLSTHSTGILTITKSKAFKKIKHPKSKRTTYTQDLRYIDNKLFMATNIGLHQRTDSGTFKAISKRRVITQKILKTDSNQIWITNNQYIERLQQTENGYTLKYLKLFKKGKYNDTRKVSGIIFKDSLAYISTIHYPMTIFKLGKGGNYWFKKRLNPKIGAVGHLPTARVNNMFKDSKGKIWIGSFGGLYQVKGEDEMLPVKQFISKGKRLSGDLITEIEEDSKGRLLVSTTKGLNILTPTDKDNYNLTIYDTSNGLPENYIRSCAVDVNGTVWVSTNTNIVRIDLEKQDVFAFGRKDGINVPIFTRSSTVSPDGKIIFGARGCYVEFDPKKVETIRKKPKLELSSLSILNNPIKAGEEFNDRVILKKAISYTKKLKITYKEKEFSIELSLLEYQKEKKNFYEYKLVGFDNDWVQLGRQRTVSFTNLPAGKYQLQARAITSEGVYVNLPSPLTIIVTPPWWKTLWFRITFILLIIVGAIGFFRYRIHAIKEKNRELEHQVLLRTQEIRQQSEEIVAQRDHLAMQKEKLEKANTLLQEHQEEITTQRDRLSEQKNELEHTNNKLNVQNSEIKQQSEEIATQRDELSRQKEKLESTNYLLKERQEEILAQNEEIRQQTEEISAQRDYVQKQNKEIEEGLMNMELLSDFGQKLTSMLSLDDIMEMVYSYVSSIVKTDAFGIGLYRDQQKRIDYHAFYEAEKALDPFSKEYCPERNFSSWAIANKKEVFENSISRNFKLYFKEEPSLCTNINAKSVLIFLLYSDEKVIGVLSVYNNKEEAFAAKDFSFLKNLSTYIAIAVANARLYGEVNRKNDHIRSSISYAQNIQKTILPLKKHMDDFVKTFTLFLPKDVVSGDFYWHSDISTPDKKEALFAVIDCTGHGVPGAFMSLIGNRILNRIVNERKVYDPAHILTALHSFIVEALKQESSDNNDGMDVALCKITYQKHNATVQYAGAKRNLYILEPSGTTKTINGTRKSIGGAKAKRSKAEFTSHTINVDKETTLYLTSDGYADQNGVNQKRFGSNKLVELLSEIHKDDMQKQMRILKQRLFEHMEGFDQRDDITIMGIKI